MKFPVQEEISYNDDSFTGRKYLHMKKFALLIEIFFPGRNLLSRGKNHLPEKIVWPRPKLPFLIENQENWFIQWEKLFEQKKEAEI